MSISQLARSIRESSTLKLNEQARLLREKGEAVIHLGIGEPKNKTPITAILSSAAKLTAGEIKYSPTDGTPSLKKAIFRYTEENYGRLVTPENVIVSVGAKQAIYHVLFTLLNPQEEVIILAPYWVSYPEMVKMVYGVPIIVHPEDGTFHPRIEEITRAVSPSTKAIIVNSPNNPSGVIYSADLIGELVEFCEHKGIYLIMDDIYHKLVFDGRQTVSPYQYTNREADNSHIIIINGVSKLYGMTGFRIGWAIAKKEIIEVMTTIQGQTTTCPSLLLQAAAEGALTGMQSTIENLRLTIQNNRDVILQQMKTFRGVKITPPQGTFYCLPDFRAYSNDSLGLTQMIFEKAMVVTVPGKDFGMEGHLRLSYAGAVKDLIEGIARIKWVLDPESPNEIYIGDKKYIRDWL